MIRSIKGMGFYPLLLALPALLQAQLKVESTFTSCSYYYSSEKSGECVVSFRKAKEKVWHKGFTPVFDSIHKEYRGSIVHLEEDSHYEIRFELEIKNKPQIIEIAKFTTWSSSPVITKTLKISTFVKTPSKEIELIGIKGKPEDWIRITGDIEINATDDQNYAILIDDCQYLIIEGITLTGGYLHGILVKETSSDVRIINCEISKWGRKPIKQNKDGVFLDRDGKMINNDGGITIDRARNIVVERCYIHDPNGFTNPWKGIIQMGEFKGEKFSRTHPQGPNGIYVRQAGGGIVLRYNDIVGSDTHRYNDPVETSENGNINGGFNKDADIYGNIMAFGQDDGIELDGGQCNVRMFNNRIEQTLCGISTAPNKKGPSYIFNNLVWNLGDFYDVSGAGIKNGGGREYTFGIQFLFNNTIISNGYGCMHGVGFACKGPDCRQEMFYAYTRNNIFMITAPEDTVKLRNNVRSPSIYDKYKITSNSFDYDMIANDNRSDGKGEIFAVEGSEINGLFTLPSFTNASNGIFTLDATDKGIDKGEVVANISETYNGNAPDIGAIEYGGNSLFPVRPVAMSADKYFVNLKKGIPETVIISFGKLDKKYIFTLKKSKDMEWLNIDPVKGQASENTSCTIKLYSQEKNASQKGMVFLRLDNGFSIPVTVYNNSLGSIKK